VPHHKRGKFLTLQKLKLNLVKGKNIIFEALFRINDKLQVTKVMRIKYIKLNKIIVDYG
jgi:hypothetical protein